MKDIYELSEEYRTLEATLNEMFEDGHIDQECIDNTMANHKGSLKDECVNLAKMVKNKQAYILGLEQRASEINSRLKELKNRIKRANNYNDYLTGVISKTLHMMDQDRIDTDDFIIKEVGKRAAVIVSDSEAIPDQYIVKKVVNEVDKTLAYDHLKKGMHIPGLKLGEDKRLDIK